MNYHVAKICYRHNCSVLWCITAIVTVFVEFLIGNLKQAIFKLAGLGRHESARTSDEI